MSHFRNLTLRKAIGAGLIALPVAGFLTALAITQGLAYVVTTLALTALSASCFIGGVRLLSSKRGHPKD